MLGFSLLATLALCLLPDTVATAAGEMPSGQTLCVPVSFLDSKLAL